MRNFAIIEDLDLEHCQNLTIKNHPELLTDCFVRNFPLIRNYAHSENQLFITKFKKKLIPNYLQELQNYTQSQTLKNRQLFYARRKITNQNSQDCKKNRQSLPELVKPSLLIQSNQFLSSQLPQPTLFHKSFPILFHEKSPIKKIRKDPKPNISKLPPSQKLICGSMLLISPKKKLTKLDSSSKIIPSKSYANIYADSLNFCQNFIFKNSFDAIVSKRESRQCTEGLIEIFNVKRSLADEKSIQKKMMNVLKKRKSSKKLKMNLFSGYVNALKSTQYDDKENTQKTGFKCINKQQAQALVKPNLAKMGLRGKLCIPMKHNRFTSSCLSDQPTFPSETIQLLDHLIDPPSINGRNQLLTTNHNKFTLPRFS